MSKNTSKLCTVDLVASTQWPLIQNVFKTLNYCLRHWGASVNKDKNFTWNLNLNLSLMRHCAILRTLPTNLIILIYYAFLAISLYFIVMSGADIRHAKYRIFRLTQENRISWNHLDKNFLLCLRWIVSVSLHSD